MGKYPTKCLLVCSLVLWALLLVAGGASVISPDTQLQGYSRLLKREAVALSGLPDQVTDCLMQEVLLRRQGIIPDDQFEALRAFCRKAARQEPAKAPGNGSLASLAERS